MNMLDLEDSSILDNKVPQYNPKPQEVVLASSKQVPINKLDLDKVSEIQKLQAKGELPPLEESKIIDKKQVRDDVKDMIIQDNDSDEDPQESMLKQAEANRQRIMLQESGNEDFDEYEDKNEYPDYGSEFDEDDLYGLEDEDIQQMLEKK